MAERDHNRQDTGDTRMDNDEPQGGISLPGTPGYESEAAFRHREFAEADMPEISPIQMAPGPLDDRDEPELMDPNQIPFREQTKHNQR